MRRPGCSEGEGPGHGRTLDVVCGMKQARETGCGESRRGAEKARGRNEARASEASRDVDASGDAAKREETQAGSARAESPERVRGAKEL